MANQITLPNLGENIESGDVLSILGSEGDTVKKNQDLIEVETDKATMPVPSPAAGKIVKILIAEGDTVKVGAALMEIDSAASENGTAKTEEKPAAKKSEPKAAAPAKKKTPEAEPEVEEAEEVEPEPAPKAPPKKAAAHAEAAAPKVKAAEPVEDAPGDGQSASAAGPAVRRLARQLGVDLRYVRPSGDGGRITADDVQAFVRETNESVAAGAPRGVTPPGQPGSDDFGGVRVEKMSRMRQAIARNMVLSYTTIPQLTNFDDVDVTELEDMREQSKGDYAARGVKLTAMPFLIKAVASSLRKHPVVNSSVDMESHQVIYKEYVNVGVAVDTERGLVVPVLRNADRKSIAQIAAELDRIAQKARDGELALDDMKGGTFTVSNLGAIGGTYSTPIINPPEVAILLVGRSRIVPQMKGSAVEGRLMMPLSITYDHRVVDGAAAARFLNEVKGYLAAPGRLLLAP
jgi:pyruvate dehydrogenase E2 component (dihydrolipoyllysine-residue acetyltransferase)